MERMLSAYLPSTWRRLAAYILDQMIMMPFYLPFAGVFVDLVFGGDEARISLFKFTLILMTPAVYEFVFLLLMNATPGKWLLGMKVTPAKDLEAGLDWHQAFLRAFVGRLSLFLSSAIYALAFFRYDRTHLVDWIAETRVVQNTPRRERPQIRWILGSLFVVYFCIEGWSAASQVMRAVDWSEKEVNLSELQDAYQIEEE